jgi:hypothetical protein
MYPIVLAKVTHLRILSFLELHGACFGRIYLALDPMVRRNKKRERIETKGLCI